MTRRRSDSPGMRLFLPHHRHPCSMWTVPYKRRKTVRKKSTSRPKPQRSGTSSQAGRMVLKRLSQPEKGKLPTMEHEASEVLRGNRQESEKGVPTELSGWIRGLLRPSAKANNSGNKKRTEPLRKTQPITTRQRHELKFRCPRCGRVISLSGSKRRRVRRLGTKGACPACGVISPVAQSLPSHGNAGGTQRLEGDRHHVWRRKAALLAAQMGMDDSFVSHLADKDLQCIQEHIGSASLRHTLVALQRRAATRQLEAHRDRCLETLRSIEARIAAVSLQEDSEDRLLNLGRQREQVAERVAEIEQKLAAQQGEDGEPELP